jgi:hypothetical protein
MRCEVVQNTVATDCGRAHDGAIAGRREACAAFLWDGVPPCGKTRGPTHKLYVIRITIV